MSNAEFDDQKKTNYAYSSFEIIISDYTVIHERKELNIVNFVVEAGDLSISAVGNNRQISRIYNT